MTNTDKFSGEGATSPLPQIPDLLERRKLKQRQVCPSKLSHQRGAVGKTRVQLGSKYMPLVHLPCLDTLDTSRIILWSHSRACLFLAASRQFQKAAPR